MTEEYDFSQSAQNPYVKNTKKQISLKINTDTIEYFKELSVKIGLPYQTLINSYLTDCAIRHLEPQLEWTS